MDHRTHGSEIPNLKIVVQPKRGKRGEATEKERALNRPRAGRGNYVIARA